MSATITVYTKPNCVQCMATKRALAKAGVAFELVDLTTNPDLVEWITTDLGYSAAPVVYVEDGTGENHWSGFRPERITAAAAWVQSCA